MLLSGDGMVLSRTFSCEASKGAEGILRRKSESRPSPVAVLGAFNVAVQTLQNMGLLSASLRRVGIFAT